MILSKISILLLLIAFNQSNCLITPTETFPNHVELSPKYDLYWKNDDQSVTFEIHFDSKWALLGVSKEVYTDYITTWINQDQTGRFNNRYANSSKFDNFGILGGNWIPLYSDKRENTTIIKFRRDAKLCNQGDHNVDIRKGQVGVVFSTGDEYIDENHIKLDKSQVKSVMLNLIDQKDTHSFSCRVEKAQPVFTSQPLAAYENYIDLSPGVFRLYWNLTNTKNGNMNGDMIGEVHCKTDGWVGFGLSPNGGMDQSDVFIGWIDKNGAINFTVNIFFVMKLHFVNDLKVFLIY